MSLDEEIKNMHRENHRKGIEMYQAGVACGIRFVVDSFLAKFDFGVRESIIKQLQEEYDG